MAGPATAPPVLSTPDTRIAEQAAAPIPPRPKRTADELGRIYEIERTAAEIRRGGWKRVALQFPDSLLPDSPKVYQLLSERLARPAEPAPPPPADPPADGAPEALYILADTSYGACCADEVAAEHVDAQVVVHYGRACLSPAARLPVIYVFTEEPLDLAAAAAAFAATYPDAAARVILMADAPYACHVPALHAALQARGYTALFATAMRHSPESALPNRTSPPPDSASDPTALRSWHLFHVSAPPPALLLTLAARVASVHVLPTDGPAAAPAALHASSALALRRRYALVTRVSRASVVGILVNTLSVHAYQDALRGAQAAIARAGKKAYVFAMGRPNPAKVANFAEVDGWVVLGCWESSLIENADFDKPLVAPFELELALRSDADRVWTGEWRGGFGSLAEQAGDSQAGDAGHGDDGEMSEPGQGGGEGSDSESEPPEYDLRTGQYILPSRPMRQKPARAAGGQAGAVARRANGDLAVIGGAPSPGAQFLRDKRTWRGLGSDFEIAYDEDGAQVAEGRSGIARGYAGERNGGGAGTD